MKAEKRQSRVHGAEEAEDVVTSEADQAPEKAQRFASSGMVVATVNSDGLNSRET